MSTTDIEALVAELQQGAKYSGVTGRIMLRAADTIERQQAVVRVLRSMDRRGLLVKELRDALAALDVPPEDQATSRAAATSGICSP